ncbi:hypothetical protein HN011_004842 [Eciton burchellii]|nr:hypothetical protein HN011_004842 [Eciton burchellii]
MLKILIGFILCLGFWILGKTQCKQCVKHVSMMSPRVTDIGRKPLLKQRVSPFPRQLPNQTQAIFHLYPQCSARHPRQRSLVQSKNRNTITANSFAN